MKIKARRNSKRVIVELEKPDRTIIETNLGAKHPLFRLKKILVPVDFSDCSKKALRYAIPFAREFGASIILLTVVQIPYHGNDFEGFSLPLLETELRNGAIKQMEKLVAEEVPIDVTRETVVKVGRPVHEIVAVEVELDVDLIVVSTHGHTGLKHMLLGSTAENVVRHAKCPVLVVREQEHEFV